MPQLTLVGKQGLIVTKELRIYSLAGYKKQRKFQERDSIQETSKRKASSQAKNKK